MKFKLRENVYIEVQHETKSYDLLQEKVVFLQNCKNSDKSLLYDEPSTMLHS